MPTTTRTAPRLGGRVLLLDSADRVLLIHALDPDSPGHHWWELPGGGVQHGEELQAAVRRELAEETGIVLTELGPELFVRESRFRYRGRDHHRVDHVYLGRCTGAETRTELAPSDNEKAGLIERRWWSAEELWHCQDKLLPATLPALLEDILAGKFDALPRVLTD